MSTTEQNLSRRSFAKASLVGGVAAAGLMGASQAKAIDVQPLENGGESLWLPDVPETWDRETEMLVLGCGAAGACALIEGQDLGLDVLGIEKNTTITGCQCARSGGWVCACNTRLQRQEEIEDSVDLFYKDIMADGGDMADPEVVRTWAELSGETLDWLCDMDVPVIEKTYDARVVALSEAHSVARDYCTEPLGNGIGWMIGLERVINDRGIEIMYETAATKVLRNAEGRAVGARVQDKDGNTLNIKASKGVLVSCGGYGVNLDIWARYSPMMDYVRNNSDEVFIVSPSTCTGDGIVMLEDVGAWMNPSKAVLGITILTDPDWKMEKLRTEMLTFVMENSPIEVTKDAKRFYDESSFHVYMTERPYLNIPGMTSYCIFDENVRTSQEGQDYCQWVLDSAEPLGRPDLVYQADTIEELAEHFGLDPEQLVATVEEFNSHVDSQEPDEFGRTRFLAKCETAPFYGVERHVSTGTSKGGARVNAKAQVMDMNLKPIPNLYSAGEDAMFSAHGDAREHVVGGCNSYAMCFGRLAARNIAEETAW